MFPFRPPENALEALLNLVYLCGLDANDPEQVRNYLTQAEAEIVDLIKMLGFEPPKDDD